ncbi:MAG: hypothetical protein DM484_04905 [Candidatus Methylumidiphilus alinenensis]|uniref:Uncharacterized protein n=1 Tax=Candidatus Methylumidiphilus alinenensis TaxID=2202197 RepID=A0A2W4RGY5_9GAMM|nr:MAG: hypothetical protein DM484_04905 [Candidatus Methylumidiphilus alinenensis]
MNKHRLLLIAFSLVLSLTTIAIAQPTSSPKSAVSETVNSSQKTIDEIRNAAAKRFSIDPSKIMPETDLVADIQRFHILIVTIKNYGHNFKLLIQ